jgi:hypothetical protein
VRLTKTPEEYAVARLQRQELPYEAMLANGREHWSTGERVYVYRRTLGRAGLWQADDAAEDADPERNLGARDERDYDVEHYVRQLQTSFASRLARGVTAEDFEAIVADPDRPALFTRRLAESRPILSVLSDPEATASWAPAGLPLCSQFLSGRASRR